MRKKILLFLLVVPVICVLAVGAYNLPPIHDRLAWRIDNLRAQIQYALKPPEKVVFVPQERATLVTLATPQVVQTIVSLPSPSASPTAKPTLPGPTPTPFPPPTFTPTLAPLPASVTLKGIIHEYQKWNNCGPSTLAMALSFWKWPGNQLDVAGVVKPNPRDKNVMPYELADFVNTQTNLKAIVRVGGDLDLLKRFLAAGFPVMIEKGFEVPKEGWMGHYEVVNGYDDAKGRFITQDSYIMPDLPVTYTDMEKFWRHFNDIYLVIYPPEQEVEVMTILGPQADETSNYQYAATKASNEIAALTGRDLYFAWYNRGSSLVNLADYAGAAAAYDQAFAQYATLEEKERPWRMIWYQTGPYFAYFYTGRYNDVINLATSTLEFSTEPALEESWFWRARAKAALGDTEGAIADYRTSLEWHPGFGPTLAQLTALGVQP